MREHKSKKGHEMVWPAGPHCPSIQPPCPAVCPNSSASEGSVPRPISRSPLCRQCRPSLSAAGSPSAQQGHCCRCHACIKPQHSTAQDRCSHSCGHSLSQQTICNTPRNGSIGLIGAQCVLLAPSRDAPFINLSGAHQVMILEVQGCELDQADNQKFA